MIKNIVFDMGNVLLKYDPYNYLKAQFSDCETVAVLYSEFFHSIDWQLCDKGELTPAQALANAKRRLPQYSHELDFVMGDWFNSLTPIEGMTDILAELKQKGYNLFLLSNTNEQFYEFSKRFDFFKLFDGLFISATEKLIKPDLAIFSAFAEKYGVIPEQSVFIDDMQQNTAAAKNIGFKTVTFTDAHTLRRALSALL